jgi:hypothetical protein
MLPINIKFQAYIPKSLGKSLLSYFQNDRRFNSNYMENYYEFKRKIEEEDSKGYRWIPEPGNFATGYFFATDNIDFHDHHSEHSKRLSIDATIDPAKIGKYSLFDKGLIFNHESHKKSVKGHQHSDDSHRVEAFIAEPGLIDAGMMMLPSTRLKSTGICKASPGEKSDELPLHVAISNALTGTYIHASDKSPEKDTTIIKVAASAGYPYLKYVAQNIDFNLRIDLYRNFDKSIRILVNGEHNDFPAYELLVDNQVLYSYDPLKHGYSGPTPYNLGIATTCFHKIYWKRE